MSRVTPEWVVFIFNLLTKPIRITQKNIRVTSKNWMGYLFVKIIQIYRRIMKENKTKYGYKRTYNFLMQ